MQRGQQTFHNDREVPIYISVEPSPECYELEPGETLTLIYEVSEEGDSLSIHVIDEGFVVWPPGEEPEVLINGGSSKGRSWTFNHMNLPKVP
jgi:hypothetical protein